VLDAFNAGHARHHAGGHDDLVEALQLLLAGTAVSRRSVTPVRFDLVPK
jgi:hypothetical protein